MKYTTLPVIRTKQLSSDYFELVLKKKREICYGPGDCLIVKKQTSEDYRPYFVASGIQEPWLRLIIRASDSTKYLQALKPGDKVRAQPKPFNVLPDLASAKKPVFICASVGISPFLSYISTFPSERLTMHVIGNASDIPNIEWIKNYPQAIIHSSASDFQAKFSASMSSDHYICAPDIQAQALKSTLASAGIKDKKIHYVDFE